MSSTLPIMPKEVRIAASHHHSGPATAPYPTTTMTAQRNAAIWSSADDETLLQARAAGENWQPIASKYFPNKTANACRKRHERLVEKRNVEDWDHEKLALLSQVYMACRKEMWEVLASRLGEKWTVVEAKCMEKGLKGLQSASRTAQRKAAADQAPGAEDRGISDHTSDSGIGLGSDAEMEVGFLAEPRSRASTWHAHAAPQQHQQDMSYQEHMRTRSLPQPLRLYQPPPPLVPARRYNNGEPVADHSPVLNGPGAMTASSSRRCSPESQNGRGGISIQSVLSD